MIVKYTFKTWQAADDAAGKVFQELHRDFAPGFENIKGHGHQIYRVFAKGERREAGTEVARYELNAYATPPVIRFDAGTSRHKTTFEGMIEAAVKEFHGLRSVGKEK